MKTLTLDHTEHHVHIDLGRECRSLSSCVLGGGVGTVRHVLNLRVQADRGGNMTHFPAPSESIREYCRKHGWEGPCIGFMTAASMKSMRQVRLEEDGAEVVCVVTSGLSNARCAGDPAECRAMPQSVPKPGTINIIVMTNITFSPAAMVEAIITITEAKTSVLHNAGVKSRVSQEYATGTGTDSAAIICQPAGPEFQYCGKHVLVGELVGRSVKQALGESIQWHLNQK